MGTPVFKQAKGWGHVSCKTGDVDADTGVVTPVSAWVPATSKRYIDKGSIEDSFSYQIYKTWRQSQGLETLAPAVLDGLISEETALEVNSWNGKRATGRRRRHYRSST